MQSGDSGVLADMERWYPADYYRKKIELIKKLLPDCGLTADVMVGYPTESDEQFINTKTLIQDIELSGLHVFRFSARQGTKAADHPPLDPKIIMERAHVLGELDQKLRDIFYERHRGTIRQALPEPNGEGWTDNYIRVDIPKTEISRGLAMYPVIAKNI
jgi:threonylcarbamoyladenosine tRNA methylthiotransferase MtaB